MLTRLVTRALVATLLGAIGALAPGAARAAATDTVVHETRLGEGLVHETLVHDDQLVNVARLSPDAPFEVRPVLSFESILGPVGVRERTSSMCVRVGCIVAVNGDFARPDEGVPLGGVVIDHEVFRTPTEVHHQVMMAVDGSRSTGSLDWTGRVVTSELESLAIDGVNVPRGEDQLVVYTDRFGDSTHTNDHGVEIVVELASTSTRLLAGRTIAARVIDVRDGAGASPLAPGRAVLSGHGRRAGDLRRLAALIDVGETGPTLLVRVDTEPDVEHSLGGTPVLVRDGRRWVADEDAGFVRGRHPRTALGWSADGDVILVTVDGRQPGYSAGMSLLDLADLMIDLGAVEAINLDGGGSTTFVVDGEVVNRPSDRLVATAGGERLVSHLATGQRVLANVERPVSSAWAIVPAGPPRPAAGDPLAAVSGELIDLPVPTTDPGSDPSGGLPLAVVMSPAVAEPDPVLAVTAAAAVVGVAVACGAVAVRSRRGGPRPVRTSPRRARGT